MKNLLKLLNNEEIKFVKYVNINKNKILYQENALCDVVGIVITGQLSIKTYSYEGVELIYSIINENQMFGNNLIYSSHPYFKGNVIAEKDSTIALIYKADLTKLLKNNENFLLAYMNILNDNTKQLNENIKLLSFDSASDRLLYFLRKNNNNYKYDSVTNLASILCLRRETLSRTLSKLSKDNIIEINNNLITKK